MQINLFEIFRSIDGHPVQKLSHNRRGADALVWSPASIIIAKAYLGFSYGKKPMTQEFTLFFATPIWAVPVLAATCT